MNIVTETDRSTVHDVFYVHVGYITLHRKSLMYTPEMKTLNTSSGDYTAIFHSPSAHDARSDRL